MSEKFQELHCEIARMQYDLHNECLGYIRRELEKLGGEIEYDPNIMILTTITKFEDWDGESYATYPVVKGLRIDGKHGRIMAKDTDCNEHNIALLSWDDQYNIADYLWEYLLRMRKNDEDRIGALEDEKARLIKMLTGKK